MCLINREVVNTLKVLESRRLGQENLSFIKKFFYIVSLIQSVLYQRFHSIVSLIQSVLYQRSHSIAHS